MKIKLFGVATEESILSKFGFGNSKAGLPEMESEVNAFIKDKKLIDIKMTTAQYSYQNTTHAVMFAMVLYEDIGAGSSSQNENSKQ